ncbi:hypothetical protein GGR51DRAFT_575536 [Nemania sp. FL0031]|nr:hypothetical protein GGR51DRAFT_575536 [Nemania sp. FL0031]
MKEIQEIKEATEAADSNIDPEERVVLEKRAAPIRSLYDSGAPLYTRARFEKALQQLNQSVAGTLENNEFKIEGMDGKIHAMPFRVTREEYSKGAKPSLLYDTIQNKTVPHLMHSSNVYVSIKPCLWLLDDDSDAGSVAELSQLFSDHKKEWEATPQFGALKTLIASNPMLSGARRVVGFALGRLAPWPLSKVLYPDNLYHSIKQYALLLSMRELIAESSGRKVQEILCFAQDPILGPIALGTLEKLGVTVLDDPAAFLEVDDATVMISISPNVPVRQIITDIARPAGIIWNKGSLEEAERHHWTDPTSTRVEAMIKNEYVDLMLPSYEPFGNRTRLYVRKE